eukprot:scaffold150792_cov35-Tisochrysis_lutea.AAC.2
MHRRSCHWLAERTRGGERWERSPSDLLPRVVRRTGACDERIGGGEDLRQVRWSSLALWGG